MKWIRPSWIALAALAATPLSAQEITLYSGRGESLVAPIIAAFEEQSGITVNVRYAGTAELAVLLQEEGDATPADLFWAQDAAALGAVVEMFAEMPEEVVEKVPAHLRDDGGRWVATSGRARVIAYSPERFSEDEWPATMAELTDERFRGRMALPPTTGSFQAHVTALRVVEGEDAAREWLEGIAANEPVIVSNNTAILQAIADGEADFGVTNNYYLGRFRTSDPEFPVENGHFSQDGDIGNLLLVAGMGVMAASDNQDEAAEFVDFLLSPQAQQYFTGEVYEYPVTSGMIAQAGTPSLDDLDRIAPDVDLNAIGDLEGTLEMLREVGLL
ncbi:iron ABC transporter substrate-binding protein [soil metagenome]